jgi:hypothetical protein
MSDQSIPAGNLVQRSEETAHAPKLAFRSDPAMIQICVELFTRATLYAGAIGLIASLTAALLAGE